jgi:hypothetical protein
MKLTRRQLSLLIENYLVTEARRDRDWIEALSISEEDKEEYRQAEIQGLKIPELSWIEKVRGTEPIRDIIPDVLEFKKPEFINKIKIKSKRLNDPSLLNLLNLSVNIYPTVNSLRAMIDKINVDISGLDRSKFVPLETGDDLEIVGKAGPWTVILPKTIRGSVSCDARVSKDTTWCTTKRSGQNLFYHYVGQGGVNMMLFYIMDYSRKPDNPVEDRQFPFEANNDSRISLGVVNSKPRMDGTNGGLSVDASNKGYEKDDLENVLGSYYDQVMSLIESSVQKHGGVSPALKTVQRAATNLDLLLKIIKDYDEEARKVFLIKVFNQDDISVDILNYFSNDSDEWVLRAVASNKKTPAETLRKMVEADKDLNKIGEEIASNPSTPGLMLASLYKKMKDRQNIGVLKYSERITHGAIQKSLAKNPSTPEETLLDIFNDSKKLTMGYSVQALLAQNTNLPFEMLQELGNGESTLARSYIAVNPLTPTDLLEELANDEDELVRMRATMNPKLKPETLIRLSDDEVANVRAQVAYNTKDPKLLEKLSNDSTPFVRAKVAINKATPTSTLEKLKNDKDPDVRLYAEENLNDRPDPDTQAFQNLNLPDHPNQINESKRYSLKFLF